LAAVDLAERKLIGIEEANEFIHEKIFYYQDKYAKKSSRRIFWSI
jgi:hypothetical protein